VKLVHVMPSYVPAFEDGGPIRAVHALCSHLARKGHDVAVHTTNRSGSRVLDVPTDRPQEIDGVVVRYHAVRWPRRLYRAPSMRAALGEAAGPETVFHLHSVFLWPIDVAAREAVRAAVPYVLSPRGMLSPALVERRGRWRKRVWLALSGRRVLDGAAKVHATSPLEAGELETLGVPRARIACVPNGVEAAGDAGAPEAFPPAVEAALAAGTAVVYVGRVHWKKGLDLVVRALPAVPESRLVIAGPDEEGQLQRLRNVAEEVGVAERVHALGSVSTAARDALFHRAAASVLPSLSENFANSVLESMAAGCPPVVSPEVGLAPVLQEESCGLVVPRTVDALAGALRRLLRDRVARDAMGRRARDCADRRFRWDVVADEMVRLYEGVLARPRLATAAR
jgi:glycosyltransferase involved in cell wall biosynthesis